MVLNTNNNRWYYLGYELTFLDLDKHRIITNDDVRGIEDFSTKFLIINGGYMDRYIKKIRDILIDCMPIHWYKCYLFF